MPILCNYMRHKMTKDDRKRDEGLTTPEDVIRYDDIPYGKDRKYQILDVYRQRDKEGKLPVIVSFHGGGWIYGTKETYQFYCMSLAQRGYAVINFNYRLSPEHRYPAQMEDCNSVVKWMLENEETYGFDLNNVYAVGDSAGGHLLSAYCAMLADEEYAHSYGIETPKDFRFNAVALNCGVYKMEEKEKDLFNMLYTYMFTRKHNKEDLDHAQSYDKIKEDFPPAFVMSCNGDFLRDQVDILVPVLEEKGIEHVVKIYGTEDNVLNHVFHVNVKSEDARICNDEECTFFDAHRR